MVNEEANPFKEKFQKIKDNANNIASLINMLLIALDNDFNTPQNSDVIDYLFIIQDYLEEHQKLLDDFLRELNLPDGKAKLMLLRTIHFDKKD